MFDGWKLLKDTYKLTELFKWHPKKNVSWRLTTAEDLLPFDNKASNVAKVTASGRDASWEKDLQPVNGREDYTFL